MLIGTIDFPPEILRACDAGELVVFAGAGVSMPPPSSLPSFQGLAERIGAGAGIMFEQNEPADRYLGRLNDKGISVHEASARILVNNDTKHTPLHRLLLEFFPSRDTVRLVTTNFFFRQSGVENIRPMIETAPLEQAADGYARMMQGKARFRMVLITKDGVAQSTPVN
jgi:hypothetical protein